MKKLFGLCALFAFIFAAVPAFAAPSGNVGFPLLSTASAGVKTSGVYDVRAYKTKTMTVSGATLASNASAITYKNMSGTVLAQCAPTSTGPWSTCIANNYAQTAASRTTNGTFTWSDAVAYIRLQWTGGTVGGKLKAWLNWLE